MKEIKNIDEIKEVITGFHNLTHIKDNLFEVELEILVNTESHINRGKKPIIENKKFLLKTD